MTAMNDEELDLLREFQKADLILYEHFQEEFERRIDEFGRENMEKAVIELRALNEQVSINKKKIDRP